MRQERKYYKVTGSSLADAASSASFRLSPRGVIEMGMHISLILKEVFHSAVWVGLIGFGDTYRISFFMAEIEDKRLMVIAVV